MKTLLVLLLSLMSVGGAEPVDASSLRGKVLCGYQGWFRSPGDAAQMGWIHWGRDGRRLTPDAVTVEMWPDLAEFPAKERYAAPGFTDAQGRQAWLFSSDNAATVRRHFEWMRTYGIDGVWLQHFVVDLPGGPSQSRYASRRRTLDHIRAAAQATGRIWALTYDVSGMPVERIFETLANDWKKLVDEGLTADPRYLREGGAPVVEVWGFYFEKGRGRISVEVGNRLLDFFKAPGPYHAFVVGGGEWDWRQKLDPDWQKMRARLDGYSPWNIGNALVDGAGETRSVTSYWAEDKAECERRGQLWLPVVYPGFSWDNLQRKAPGTTTIPRRKGRFLWEQFHALSQLGVDSVCVAMFDEVDEGTAIFKVSNNPPVQAHFLTLEGLPSDWYLRLVGEATRLLREKVPLPAEIPLQPAP